MAPETPDFPFDPEIPSELARYGLESNDEEDFEFDPRTEDEQQAAFDPSRDHDGDEDDEKRRLPLWQELPLLLLVALVVAIVVKTFLFQSYFIPSESMRYTLEIDDRVAVNKLSYTFGEVQRGHIVVFDTATGDDSEPFFSAVVRLVAESIGLSSPDSVVIKRVVGLGGETIEVVDDQVFVDGVALAEPYLGPEASMPNFGPVTVPAGSYFLMGDNRGRSSDSRRIGAIPEEDLIGRAFLRMWPLSRWSGL